MIQENVRSEKIAREEKMFQRDKVERTTYLLYPPVQPFFAVSLTAPEQGNTTAEC